MKRNRKRLPAFLLAVMLCLSLLPVTAGAVETFPSKFYASVNYDYSSYSKSEIFGTVTRSSSGLTYTVCGEKTDRVVYGMEYAGGAFYTVEGTKLNHNADDGFRELRMYNSDLTSYRTIGTVNQKNANYWIVDTAMDLSGEEPALYGTYNQAFEISGSLTAFTTVCSIDLTDGHTSNWLQVTGLSSTSDIIYAMAFDEDGTLYAIGADAGEDGGPATLYTIDLENGQTGTYGSKTVTATKVEAIKDGSGNPISTNWIQDLAFDHANNTLYWAENAENVLYTLDTETAVATEVGKLPALQSFCIPYDDAFEQNKHMISVICEGAGTVTSNNDNKPFYMVEANGNLTLNITPEKGSGLRSVKVDGKDVPLEGLIDNGYTFSNVTGNHVVEVAFKVPIPATQKTVTWLHYQGEPAKFYTVDNVYKFYDLPYLDQDVPREDYVQTLLDEDGKPINDDEIILPGNYDVHVTHPGNDKYAALDEVYDDALQLGRCPGTPGRPVVYGKVGCTQGDLTTISALQDYYGTDGKLIDAAHDEIPVTLVWQNPETRYDTAGNFNANATIYAAQNLDQRLKDCYNLDDGTPLTGGCLISSRATQVVVLPADEASLIKVQTSDASGGTVSGQGVYKNGDSVTVTATANTDYTFQGWQEDGKTVSNNSSYTFTANGDHTLTALFKPPEKEYYVALSVDPVGAGTVTGSGSYETGNHEATVTATAKAGYYFIGWYKAGETEAVSTNAEYALNVPRDGISLTAKFGVDYLIQAEQAKTSFENALKNDTLSWATLNDAVDAYEAAKTFVENPPSSITDAQDRFDVLTTYYNSVQTLDLSNQNIDSADLAKLALFTGVTDLNLSGNKGVTSLSNLTRMTQLETLDLSGTGVTDLSSLSSLTKLETLDISGTGVTTLDSLVPEDSSTFPGSKTLTAKNLSLAYISALANLVSAEGFSTETVTKWDFTGSILPGTEENKADVEAIQTALDDKFLPPTVPDNTYTISASPATLDFGSVYPNYTQPAARTVTIKNTGNQTVTLVQPTSEHYILSDLSATELAPNGTATFTVQPKPGLDVNTYNEALTVTVSSGDKTVKATVQLQFEVKQQTGGGGGGGVATYTVTVGNAEHGKVTASPTRAGSGSTVTLTVKPDQGYALDTLTATDAKGNEVKLTDKGNGTYTFTMPASKVKIAASFKESAEQVTNPFIDVFEGDYYYDAVLWAVEQGVTNGTSATTFSPNVTVTRAQMVTFLWRAHGAPAAAGSNPFADVSRDAYYYDAVLWAAANGVTNGTSAAAFSPDAPVTRAQAVTFQWRAHGAPEAAGDSFGDVPADAYYSQAVAWAAANGITNGTGADTFSPEAAVSRAQAVTFLWRELA